MTENPGFDEAKYELRKILWEAVKQRANGICEKCGSEFKIRKGQIAASVHHRHIRRHEGQDLIENLVHLCNPCHKGIHKSGLTESIAAHTGFIAWGDEKVTPILLHGTRWVLLSENGYKDVETGWAQSIITAMSELEPDMQQSEMAMEEFDGDSQLEPVDLGRNV